MARRTERILAEARLRAALLGLPQDPAIEEVVEELIRRELVCGSPDHYIIREALAMHCRLLGHHAAGWAGVAGRVRALLQNSDCRFGMVWGALLATEPGNRPFLL